MIDAGKAIRAAYRLALGTTYDVYDVAPGSTINPVIVFNEIRQHWETGADMSAVEVDLQCMKFVNNTDLMTCMDDIDTVAEHVLNNISDDTLDCADTVYITYTEVLQTRAWSVDTPSGQRLMIKQITIKHQLGEV